MTDRRMTGAGRLTFIVRLSQDGAGRLTGIVERVRTGEKEPVHGLEAIGPVIARMVQREQGQAERTGREGRRP